MDRVGDSIEKAQQTFVKAKEQLSTGRGSVVRQVEMLRELGAKSGKSLPAGWDGGSEEEPTLRLVGEEPGDRN
jgi:DNA recombination protein RmuC